MELIVILALLVLLQCTAHLPAGATGFVRLGRGSLAFDGPRWWLQSPLPGSVGYVGSRPLVLDAREGGLCARSSARHPLLGSVQAATPEIVAGPSAAVEVRGAVVLLDGIPFVRCPDEPHAHRLAAALRPGENGNVADRLATVARQSCDLAELESARAGLDSALRPLTIATAGYAALLLGVVPVAMGGFGSEAALYWLWLPVVLAHLAAFASVAACVRRVDLRHGRFELLLPALLYPPALLRARSDLARIQLSAFHPAAFALQLLAPSEARAFLRRELARLLHPRTGEVRGPVAQGELAGLRDLLVARGLAEAELLAPGPSRVAGEARYCPVCLDAFTAAGERCRLCAVPLLDSPSAPG